MTSPLSAAAAAPPSPGLRPGAPNRPDRFLHEVRAGVPHWVRALLIQALEDMGSAQQVHAVASDRHHTAPAMTLLKNQLQALADRITQELHAALDRGEPAPAAARSARPTLSLMDESQIDEDIEIGRLVQAIDSGAELELQQLAALCGGLRGLPHVDARAVPLPPLTCALAIRHGVLALSPDAGTRGLLLRQLGHAAGRQMKAVYTAQAELLTRWGIEPAPFRLVLTASQDAPPSPARAPQAAAAAHAATGAPHPRPEPVPNDALQRLVAHARDSLAREHQLGALDEPLDASPLLRLIDDPLPLAAPPRSPRALDNDTATRLMERLFTHLQQQAGLSEHSRALLSGLQGPGKALAASEPTLWQSLDHPWWKLMDRLIGVAAVPGGSAPEGADAADTIDPVTQALGEVVVRMGRSPTADRQAWQAASDEVQAAAERAVSDCQQALAPQLDSLQSQVDQEELETELRNQIVQQLRSTPVCPGLRQFLLGPWAQVLTQTALRHGSDSPQMNQRALVVDDLIQAAHEPGKRVSSAQRKVLLRQAREGLIEAGLPATRVDAEINDLQALLRDPPPAQAEDWTEAVEPLPAAWVLDLNAALPTVPMGMVADAPATAAAGTSPVWTATLEPGIHCRLFLLGRWMTVQLAWVSDTRNLFLFNSRHGGRVHSLTRRMLMKLREAGLATSIEDGLLLAQAMDSLVATDFAAG